LGHGDTVFWFTTRVKISNHRGTIPSQVKSTVDKNGLLFASFEQFYRVTDLIWFEFKRYDVVVGVSG
jgi:hypothetical protein